MHNAIIGSTTTYTGSEIPGFKGARVRIFAVMRGALRADFNPDDATSFVRDDATLARLGGVTKDDRIDVAHVKRDGTTSFVHCDARAIDLECFQHLAD